MSLPRLQQWSLPRQAVQQLLRGATLRTCTPVAVVVGSLLSVVNEGDVVASGVSDGRVVFKVVVNLLIPFVTSSTGALLAVRTRAGATCLGEESSR